MPHYATVSLCFLLLAADWPQFRGPNGAGVADDSALPTEFSPQKNVAWKTSVPPGHSSPILTKTRIFLTAYENGKLLTLCLDRATGKILWRREAPRPRIEEAQPTNSPASPSPVTDGENVYVFFGDFGLISYSADGKERWNLPLGPFNNQNGHGSSPILAGKMVILICDRIQIPTCWLSTRLLGKSAGRRRGLIRREAMRLPRSINRKTLPPN
jgi:outer membrane protein assembly factor BamB